MNRPGRQITREAGVKRRMSGTNEERTAVSKSPGGKTGPAQVKVSLEDQFRYGEKNEIVRKLALLFFWAVRTAKHSLMYCIRCFFCLFPIDENKILFGCFSGKKYADSPKYISEALHEAHPEITIVWQQKKGCRLDVPEYVKTVNNPTVRWMYELMTSKVWVDSHLKPRYLRKRKGQFFLNTWHGGLGFKKIEEDVSNPQKKTEKQKARHTARITDVFLSNSKWIEDIYRSAFRYDGKILRSGFPKNDLFFTDLTNVRNKVREHYKSGDRYVVLYAPTFRDLPKEEQYSINPEKIIETAKNTLGKGKEVIFWIRFHPVMKGFAKQFFTFSETVVNVTEYPDTQEIIAAADCVISDYSSIVFDVMLLKRPVFLFVPDYDAYKKERGFYLELEDYPFGYGKSTEEVCRRIEEFSEEKYLEKIREFSERVELTETGNAARTCVKLLAEKLGNSLPDHQRRTGVA